MRHMNKTSKIILVIVLIVVAVIIYFSLPKPNNMTSTLNNNQPTQSPEGTSAQSATNFNIQGMKVEVLKQGTGNGAKVGDNIQVNYTGTLLDGTKFDSSLNPGRTPFPYTLGQNQVIQGWELGLLGMKVGEERKLTIPPELGYGAQGANGVIPPNATLIFVIDMLSINGK